MKYMERRGSGLKKIINETKSLIGYTEEFKPEFESTATEFRVILKNVNYSDQVSDQDSDQDIFIKIIDFCKVERNKKEICEHLGFGNLTYFTRKYLKPLIENEDIAFTIPDKPNSKNQKYVSVR